MKKLYLPVLAVLALASCSKSELAVRPDNGQVEIKATSQALSIDTRAPFEGAISVDNNLKAYVIMSKTSGDYTTPYGTAGTMTFTDDNTTAVSFDVTPQYYPADDSEIYLAALYPETGWESIGTTASFNVDGKSDLMATVQQTSKKSTAGSAVPTFSFRHLLTKLTVEVKAENQAAIDAWGAITAMIVEKGDDAKLGKTAVVTLADGTAATGAGFWSNVDNLPFFTITDGTNYTDDVVDGTDHKITLTEAPVLAAYSLVPPINAKEGTTNFQLSVTTEKSGKAISFPVNLKDDGGVDAFTGDTQGKAFKITITFKATEIQAKATVTAWEDAGSSDVTIE